MEQCTLGIIILNYNTYQETIDCIKSIEVQTKSYYNIYVVDNNSSDRSAYRLKEKYNNEDNIYIIENDVNKGYSAGNNIGIKKAIEDKNDIIFIVNSDVELLNDAFTQMAHTLLSDNKYMMVGPSITNNDGKESQIPRKKLDFKLFVLERHPFCCIPLLTKRANRLYSINKKDVFSFDGSVSGCCFGMRAKDFREIDFFDENVFLYYEEDILAYKMESKNKKAVVDKRAKVWHKESVSTKKKGSAFVQFHRWISVLYLLKQYTQINKLNQVLVALWNTVTWSVLSIISKDHRKMLKAFWKKNWKIVFSG